MTDRKLPYILELSELERTVVLDALRLAADCWKDPEGYGTAEDLHDRITNRRVGR